MSVAVTGGNGFLGGHVLAALQRRGYDHVALIRSRAADAAIAPERQHIVDFSNPDSLRQSLRGVTMLLHLAGRVNGRVDDLRDANPNLMRKLVEASVAGGVKKIVYVSSAAAAFRHGPYGQSKWEAEEILKSSGIGYLIFRPTLMYGSRDNKNVATMEKVIHWLPVIPLLGNGASLIQPVYVEDVVAVLVQSLQTDLAHRVYALAGPAQISLKEMLLALADAMGKRPVMLPIPLEPLQVCVRAWATLFPRTRLPVKQILEMNQHRAFDIGPAQKDFDFSPRPFREGVRAMRSSETSGKTKPCGV